MPRLSYAICPEDGARGKLVRAAPSVCFRNDGSRRLSTGCGLSRRGSRSSATGPKRIYHRDHPRIAKFITLGRYAFEAPARAAENGLGNIRGGRRCAPDREALLMRRSNAHEFHASGNDVQKLGGQFAIRFCKLIQDREVVVA